MITFDDVTLTPAGATRPVLDGVSLTIAEGDLCLVVGRTGSGKSTLLGAVNGLVPHFTGATMRGTVTVAGRSTRDHPPRQLARLVGYVGQDPARGFVTDRVEDEIAYGMEQLGITPTAMRKRVEETCDLLGIGDLRRRALTTLSGGQQQRVAIASVLAAQPRVLVLDEPTSALDPTAAGDVLAAITSLVHDVGLTVVLAEHRLERVMQAADQVVWLPGDGSAVNGDGPQVLARADVRPPLAALAHELGWARVPLDVRQARRTVRSEHPELAAEPDDVGGVAGSGGVRVAAGRVDAGAVGRSAGIRGGAGRDDAGAVARRDDAGAVTGPASGQGVAGRHDAGAVGRPAGTGRDRPAPAVAARGLTVRYGSTTAVDGLDLSLDAGQVTVVMGRNGAGKSSLLWALAGATPSTGALTVAGTDPRPRAASAARRVVALVPQTASDLLYLPTVAAECAQADRESRVASGSTARLLARLDGAGEATGARGPLLCASPHADPADLSEGQRLGLVLAVQLVARPAVVLLDEPTRGLDYATKERLAGLLRELAREGATVVVATHDVEFAADVADRAVILADGQVVADGPAREICTASPAYAPQLAKVFWPWPWLTLDDVRAGLQLASAAGTAATGGVR
ncbi:ABC transporter ATP-binding protein [Xylanimonas allomyrinae]|uniref:ABC transporter ATP-binding protein n=1 Tax=Xylanimonas allomyrinae TaxID=2509459 RepID=A0A4P6EKT7_9MICO|nr:ABC transporter ATP-binding protein [Xylanimonas allomyrinae]QAY63320.1 ABC transporter ATP-binding protein [Xylanimonas allomyrinae]